MSSLEGRVVAIAGAAGGLGPVVAQRLGAAGATIAATDVAADRLEALAAELSLPGERWDGRVIDLLDPEDTRRWSRALEERFGGVDCLLHLVGGWRGGAPLQEAPLEDWDFLHGLLVRTVQHTTRAFHGALTASTRGRFALVSATQAQNPSSGSAAYAAAKAAAEAWTLALADELSGSAATANVVVVEAILTPQMRAAEPDRSFARFTPAEHIAEALCFLCSDEAAAMNGQRLALHP